MLLLAATVVVGSGVARHVLLPGGPWRFTRAFVLVGAGLLLVFSCLEIYATITSVLGRVDAELLGRYATATRHGRAVLVRLAATLVLAGLLLARERRWITWAAAPLTLLLLGTFSFTSHAAAMGGWQPLLGDLVHFAAATVWAGVLLQVAASGLWAPGRGAELAVVMRRVAAIGLWSVIVLAVTGPLLALFHASEPAAFVTSSYAGALVAKTVLVLAAVGVAAVNRFVLLPRLARPGAHDSGPVPADSTDAARASLRLRNVLWLECALLLAVFAATGVLTTSELPHAAPVGAANDPLTNFSNLIDYLRR